MPADEPTPEAAERAAKAAELQQRLERRRLQLFQFTDRWVVMSIQQDISRIEQELRDLLSG